jgi:hypothetical protein
MKAKNGVLIVLFLLAFVLVTSTWQEGSAQSSIAQIQGSILYVKPGASGTCTSWENACDLRNALGATYSGDQVWVAAGTYYPSITNDRSETFPLRIGVNIYGGFAGTETSLGERDLANNLTILSGDIGIPDNNTDNSYHVVTGSAVDETAVLDGFYIRFGYANGAYPENYGGGMINIIGSPTLRNIVFYGNSAEIGGGVFTYQGNTVLTNVIFASNIATHYGGGMYSHTSNPILNNVIFSENTSQEGAGMYNYLSNFSMINVTFYSNATSLSSSGRGGGIYNYQSSPTIINSTIIGNSARYGGGIFNYNQSVPILTNTTIADNTADLAAANGGGIYNSSNCSTTIRNAILWGNAPDQIFGSATATYSDIQDGYAGTGIIDQDPLLAQLVYDGGFILIQPIIFGSPAIDAGDPENCPATDQRGYSRPIDGDGDGVASCDMGSYEYEFTPTLTYLPAILK